MNKFIPIAFFLIVSCAPEEQESIVWEWSEEELACAEYVRTELVTGDVQIPQEKILKGCRFRINAGISYLNPKLEDWHIRSLADAPAIQQPEPTTAWKYSTSTDQMTGEETGYLVGYSRNSLTGRQRNGKALIGYNCDSVMGFYVKANDLGFASDETQCYLGCADYQYPRVRFDDGPTTRVTFEIWDDDVDGMSLMASLFDDELSSKYVLASEYFIDRMKAGQKMYLELELLGTNGNEQIAEFDLTGFTEAYNNCP